MGDDKEKTCENGRDSAAGRRRLSSSRTYSAEDQALNTIAKEAEQRLAAKRAARAEARELRMKEIEKQQKEAEKAESQGAGDSSNGKIKPTAVRTTPAIPPTRQTSYHQFASRRASEDSSLGDKDLRAQLAETDEKYKKAMLTNAQLENEKQMYKYQVENLKDQIEDLEEISTETNRRFKEKKRECDLEKRTKKELERETACLKDQIKKRDTLIQEHGLVLVGKDEVETKDGIKLVSQATLLAADTAQFLAEAGEGSLDDRLRKFVQEKKDLEDEVRRLRADLEESRERNSLAQKYGSLEGSPKINGPDIEDIQREASRQVSDYAFKLSKAEQDISSLESSVSRLESQVKRYKSASENSEQAEEELKSEKRRLARELRESQTLLEEVQSQNGHLQKRLDKLKSSRNALLK